MEASAASGDVPGFFEGDQAFHLGLLELSGNEHLVTLAGQLRDRTWRYGVVTEDTTAVLRELVS